MLKRRNNVWDYKKYFQICIQSFYNFFFFLTLFRKRNLNLAVSELYTKERIIVHDYRLKYVKTTMI